jgi:rare lipoprotein A (peptidoglycan hydrolase)
VAEPRKTELIEKILVIVLAMNVQWGSVDVPALPEMTVQHTGLASWYGSGVKNDYGLHGSITATGEPFDPSKKTCAMRAAPLRRAVLVRLTRTGHKTWCLVNDRGPYGALDDEGLWITKFSREDPGEWRGVIDLSRATAVALGFDFQRGLEQVEILYTTH